MINQLLNSVLTRFKELCRSWRISLQAYVHNTPDKRNFSCRNGIERIATTQNWNKSFTNNEHRYEDERFGELKPSPNPRIFSSISVDSLILIHFRFRPHNCSHCTELWHKHYPLCDAPLSRSAPAAQLGLVTEIISPKLWFLCVNRSPIRHGFRAGVRAIRYSVNIT